ncbi:cell wall hydrolase [Roseovarius confluentis]|uniref:cell wall hydrolase n=1 Tax=Roseovarius confluentis TaxID=1852027 RepID=UPI0014767181|nr:cell wall hydrolase [Roseovarius confluentis]
MLYSFGAGTGVSYEQLQQRRKIVDALQKQNTRTPRNAGEGVHAIAKALVARGVDRQNTEAAEKLREQYSGLWEGLMGAPGGAQGGYSGSYTGSGATGQTAGNFSAQPQSTQERMGLDMGQSDEAFASGQNPTETVGGVSYDIGREVGNPQDRILLAKTLEAEAGGEGLDGMLAAGAVINNRVKAGGYGDGLQGVIMKPGQFSAWNSVTGYAGGEGGLDMNRIQPSQTALQAADMLLAGHYDDPTGGATHYYNPSVATPKWGMQAGGNWKRIGNHVFGFGDGNPGGGGSSPRGGVQTAQAGGIDPSIVQLAQMLSAPDEFMPPGQKAIAEALLQRKFAQSQPMTPLEQQQFQMNQMEMERMGQQAPDVVDINGVDATWDAQQGRYVPVEGFEAQPEFSMLSPQEVQQLGLPDGAYQRGADGKVYQVGGGGTNVTVNNGGGKFAEEFAKTDAQALAAVSESGLAAQRNLGRIDQLESLLSESPSGFGALAKQYAGEWGIKTEGLEDIQAATALINSLVPEQRQPGSGPMSDADLALFKQSLPRIINQPGGNETIIRTMRGIAQYDAEGAAIVQDLRAGKLTRAEAFDKLRNRANPLEGFEAPKGNKDQVSSDNPYIGLSSEDFKKIDLDTLTFEQLQQLDEARKAQRGQ